MISWVGVSIGFSYYVENMSRFNVLYGSLGAVIVLMLWLYLTGIILILGSEVNQILIQMKENNNRLPPIELPSLKNSISHIYSDRKNSCRKTEKDKKRNCRRM